MYNVYSDKKFIASFARLTDARVYVSSVLVRDFSRKGYELKYSFCFRGTPQKYYFCRENSSHVVLISRV